MTVKFALFLSPEGIALAHRQDAGHWAMIGEAPFAADDLAARMGALKTAITARGGGDDPLLLVLPDDQILYTSFTAPTHDAALVRDRIIAGLDGLTPYAVADLVHDWRAVEDDRIKVAVVARETLDEANAFAAEHGLGVAGFAAMPPVERFPGMPVFGEATPAISTATMDLRFGPDLWVAPAETPPEAAAADAADAAPDTQDVANEDSGTDEGGAAMPAATAPAAPKPKATRKSAAKGDAAAVSAAAPELPLTDAQPVVGEVAATQEQDSPSDKAPEAAVPDAQADTTDQPKSQDSAEDAVAPEAEAEAEAKAKDKDSAMDAPAAGSVSVAPDAPAADTPDAPTADTEKADDRRTAPPATEEQEPAALAALLDPMFDRTITPIAENAPEDTAQDAPPAATGQSPSAARGKVARPKVDGRTLTAEKPDTAPPRPSGATPILPPDDDSGSAADTAGDDTASSAPIFGFSAKRRAPGKAGATANGQSGQIVANLRGRLGFGAAPAAQEKQRHPDVSVPPARRVDTVAERPGTAFVAQLARVRDASKTRRKPEGAAARAPDAAQGAPADHPENAGAGASPSIAARIMGRGAAKPAAGAPSGADSALAAGLLARKPSQPAGPSLRTGLLLTVVLLILLVLIAIWSVVFLPDSPMARILSGGNTTQTAQSATADDAVVPIASVDATTRIAAAPPLASAVDPEELADGEVVEAAEAVTIPAPAAPAQSAQLPAAPATPLPDIDADLELPPLATTAEELLPTIAEAEALYADARIWPRPPERPFFSPFTLTDDIYIASIDPEIVSFDAVALADPRIDIDEVLRRVPAPPAFGLQLERDARGLVTATAQGVLTPEGAFVILGRPAVVALPRPTEIAPEPPQAETLNVAGALLATIAPRQRPTDLDETRERQLLGGLSRSELAAMRPTLRPISAQESAARASLFPQADATTATTTPAPVTGGTARAVAASRVPPLRPADFATIVAAATRPPAQQATVTAAAFAPAPSIPSNADVARAATNRNEIRLRDVNLIGVSGTSSNRTALVRLSSGRFVRVAVGDRLDGGRVAAIGADSLQYVVNGRNITLEIPG